MKIVRAIQSQKIDNKKVTALIPPLEEAVKGVLAREQKYLSVLDILT